MSKKNILVTGSTDGIGKLVAIRFAKEGHRVFVHGRSPEKVNTLVSEMKKATNNEEIDGFVADFSDLKAVREMAQDVIGKVSHIDVLINNAGVFKTPILLNKDGMDLRFVVNYLAPYLLTKDLLPVLKKGNETRIINLSSAAQSPVSYDVMLGKSNVSLNESYAQSKLALTMWSFDLAKQLNDIAVIAVNPGSLLNTKMANEAYGQHWSPADKGSNILYDLAVSEDHQGITGKYFDNDNGVYAQAHPDAYNQAAIQELTEQTEKIIA
ncbi:short-chain dehydrogenase [Labilibaculum filiforme]|uniref:Short-chain dehydrogenase n=1 Tax=Labilibaculum filiforme TaxID=1940526 RepID=A0A2N3I5E0_9BACT|nr:SDR family NAD(P)-dependent oxidoreductase [Labilibaculum filiforme]PKQ65516.1 short-chain dehydrogenase [Labilibaculum filiforme]